MADERVWLKHPEHGGYFACPVEAVEAWTSPEMGWQVADDEPVEHNPVIAEALAARAEAELAEAEQAGEKKPRKAAKATTTTISEEG